MLFPLSADRGVASLGDVSFVDGVVFVGEVTFVGLLVVGVFTSAGVVVLVVSVVFGEVTS